MKNYSFGLENIYKLEKVDPSTIRTFQPPVQEIRETPCPTLLSPDDFLGGFPNLSLWDRVERLQLPPPLFYQLKKEGWETLEELLSAILESHPKILALPRPLQDHLEKALAPYRKNGKVSKLDLKGFLRGLGKGSHPLSYLAFLSSLDLLSFYGVTPYEKVQVERLSEEERQERTLETESRLREKDLSPLFQEVAHGLLAGWIEKRGGDHDRTGADGKDRTRIVRAWRREGVYPIDDKAL